MFYLIMGKEVRLNIRIKPNLKAELEAVADFHGLTTSSYVHSILVRQMRKERQEMPDVFEQVEKDLLAEMKSASRRTAKSLGSMSAEAKQRKAA